VHLEEKVNAANRATYPRHAYPSKRAFRAQKRRDAKVAERAVWNLVSGCAFTPARDNALALLRAVREIRRQFSVKEWGR